MKVIVSCAFIVVFAAFQKCVVVVATGAQQTVTTTTSLTSVFD
jgi:hypothetical protein